MELAEVVFMLGWIVLIIGLTVLAYKFKFQWLLLMPMLFWFALSMWCWNRTDPSSPTAYDIFWIVKYVSIVMAFATAAMMMSFRVMTEGKDAEPLDETEDYRQKQEAEWMRIRKMGKKPRKPLPPI